MVTDPKSLANRDDADNMCRRTHVMTVSCSVFAILQADLGLQHVTKGENKQTIKTITPVKIIPKPL